MEFSFEILSAQVIGRKIKGIIGDSAELKYRVETSILTHQINPMVEKFVKGSELTEVFAKRILTALLKGVSE